MCHGNVKATHKYLNMYKIRLNYNAQLIAHFIQNKIQWDFNLQNNFYR